MREGWTRLRFDEIAENITDRVDNPAEAGVDRYVGLEHLDSDSLTIRRWGVPTDVEATKLRFRVGDIILGRRRVYQRKLAVADFDGICSAHALVVRARGRCVEPAFLPHFMRTGAFMDRALQISVGSLSPTINWKALAAEEFSLPPIVEQRRITLLLAAIEREHAALERAGQSSAAVRTAWLDSALTQLAVEAPTLAAPSVLDRLTVGIVVRPADLYVPRGQGVPALRSLNVVPGRIVLDDLVEISLDGHASNSKSAIRRGDVVVVRTGRPGEAAVIDGTLGELNAIDLIICTPGGRVLPEYLCAVINSSFGRRQFDAGMGGTAQQHFNVGAFKHFMLPVPQLGRQAEIVELLRRLESAGQIVRSQMEAVASFREAALRGLFD